MKKLYVTHEFKIRQITVRKKSERKFRNRRSKILKVVRGKKKKQNSLLFKSKAPNQIRSIYAPKDFRIAHNPEGCLHFFRELRNRENVSDYKGFNIIQMSLDNVEQIDYGTISIVNAISEDFKEKDIILRGNFPKNQECFNYMLDSGYLNHMYIDNKKVDKSKNSDLIFFEKGKGKLSDSESIKIGEMIKNVVNHLTGERVHCKRLRTIILEICGNSIEHASTINRQWLLGIKYQEEKVIFTVTDVGKGILETLNRKHSLVFGDNLLFRKDHEVLQRAFIQKYGSSTRETNRNKGLPSIKAGSDNGTILNLITLTNNVMLNFQNEKLSKTLQKGSARFKGTFYQWEVTKDCIL